MHAENSNRVQNKRRMYKTSWLGYESARIEENGLPERTENKGLVLDIDMPSGRN